MQTSNKIPVLLGIDHYRNRVVEIQECLNAQALDGILFLNPYNVMWASGFFHIPSERPLGFYVPANGESTFYVPRLEKEHTEEHNLGKVCWYWEYPGSTPAEVWMMQQIAEQKIVVDGVSHHLFEQMQAVKPDLGIDTAVTKLRYLKTDTEIALTEKAAHYADFGLGVARQAVSECFDQGITEIEVVHTVVAETTAKMKRELQEISNAFLGAVGLTAHAGPRGALPHGQPGPVTIRPGDTLIVGIGAAVGGYRAESGCTFIVGEPTADQLRCLEATWACDQAGVDALIPGNTCQSVDEAALSVLRDYGYDEYILHRIGHGMGVRNHEAPWLSEGDETIMLPSMVFSNEPGIYRPGVDGYRIIDSMVVTQDGGRRLSRYLSEHGPDDRVISI